MVHEHLNASRVWVLIRENGKLGPEETKHIEVCDICREWLVDFLDMAKRAGFKLSLEIPQNKLDRTGTSG